jgi:hypothetical protein
MSLSYTDEIVRFQRQLNETVAWCASIDWANNPGELLRSSILCPPAIRSDLQAIIEAHLSSEESRELRSIDNKNVHQQWQQNVEQLATKRAYLLLKQNSFAFSSVQTWQNGRLLAFDPQNSLDDGFVEAVTHGFFDAWNRPAWDTWISYIIEGWEPQYFRTYLLSWVPGSLIEIVATGIDSNMEECIRWASDLDTPFIRQLSQEGLLR